MARKAKQAAPRVAVSKSRGKRKLLDQQVLDIVSARATGAKMTKLAADFAVSVSTISSIINGRTYAWLTKIGLAGDAELAAAA